MRRAVIATVGTVVGLAALLSYKSGGSTTGVRVSAGTSPATTTVPGAVGSSTGSATTTLPSTSSATSPTSRVTSTTAVTAVSGGRRTYTGEEVSYRYGEIEVAVTLEGAKLVDISVPENYSPDPHSEALNSMAVPILEREALAAQGLDFDVVSGASYTSDAFAQSLQTALERAKQ